MKSNYPLLMSLPINCLDLKNKTIVIVEDDTPSVKYYQTILKNSGAVVKFFNNGKEFIDYFSTTHNRIDLVVIDFLIPLVNGIDCVRLFKKARKDVPVLMITAYFSEATKNEAFLAGCNEYILKPVFPEKILYLLEKYLKPEAAYSKTF